jgi:FtsH-binding integral membrane protein
MKTSTKILLWTPRILCILAILFVSLFAADAFSPERTFWQNIGAFLMHLVPSFILLAVLIISWKWGHIGGIIFIVVGVFFGISVFNLNYNQRHFTLLQSIINVSLLCLPFVIAGVLFIISHFRRKRELASAE